VFEISESLLFSDEENKLIYIDDQYCMNPKCKCNEVYLSFVEIDETESKSKHIFTLRYSINNGKYEVENSLSTEEDMKKLIKIFKQEEKETLEILKKRYKAMKNAGTKIYNEKKNEAI
jgi:hypothetical protein